MYFPVNVIHPPPSIQSLILPKRMLADYNQEVATTQYLCTIHQLTASCCVYAELQYKYHIYYMYSHVIGPKSLIQPTVILYIHQKLENLLGACTFFSVDLK